MVATAVYLQLRDQENKMISSSREEISSCNRKCQDNSPLKPNKTYLKKTKTVGKSLSQTPSVIFDFMNQF